MQMRQPAYRPPPWLFGPAWTVLYGLMGYSAYRAMNTGLTSINPVTRNLALVRPSLTYPYPNLATKRWCGW